MNKKNVDKLKSSFWLLIFIGGIIAIFFYIKSKNVLNVMDSAEAFQKYIEGYGDKAYLVFFIVQFISVIIAPIPSNISTMIGGSIFGMWQSFFISTLAIISGSIIVFILSRKLGRPFVDRFVSDKIIERYERSLSSKNGELLLILLLFLPFFPDDAIGFLVGLSKIKLRRYSVILLLTRPWEILTASALGSSNIIIPWWGWGIITGFIIYVVKNSDMLEEKLLSIFKGY